MVLSVLSLLIHYRMRDKGTRIMHTRCTSDWRKFFVALSRSSGGHFIGGMGVTFSPPEHPRPYLTIITDIILLYLRVTEVGRKVLHTLALE